MKNLSANRVFDLLGEVEAPAEDAFTRLDPAPPEVKFPLPPPFIHTAETGEQVQVWISPIRAFQYAETETRPAGWIGYFNAYLVVGSLGFYFTDIQIVRRRLYCPAGRSFGSGHPRTFCFFSETAAEAIGAGLLASEHYRMYADILPLEYGRFWRGLKYGKEALSAVFNGQSQKFPLTKAAAAKSARKAAKKPKAPKSWRPV